MTTDNHTPISTGAAANASVINEPLGELDAAISAAQADADAAQVEIAAARGIYANLDARFDADEADIDALETEMTAARGGYADVDSRISALALAGGGAATLTNGAASAGQKIVTVDSTAGFFAGVSISYYLAGGELETNVIDTIDSATQMALTTNIGSGGIADNEVVAQMTPLETDLLNVSQRSVASAGATNSKDGHGGNIISSSAEGSTVSGGGTGAASLIGKADASNVIGAASVATIGGGYDNIIRDGAIASTIAGGAHHEIAAYATHNTIGGGSLNKLDGTSDFSTIVGGTRNSNTNADYSVLGGYQNENTADNSAVFGLSNVNSGANSAVAGNTNDNSGNGAIVGGLNNDNDGNYSLLHGVNADNSGSSSTVIGNNNSNTADNSFVAGTNNVNSAAGGFVTGNTNDNSGISAVVAGNNNDNDGQQAIVVGASNTNTGTGALVVGVSNSGGGNYNATAGLSNNNSGQYALVAGRDIENTKNYSTAFGRYTKPDIAGSQNFANGRIAANGDSQLTTVHLRGQTTDASTLYLSGSVGNADIVVPSDTTYGFVAHIVGRRTDADNESAFYKIEGCIDNNAGTTALVGSVTKTVIAEDTAAWDATAIAYDAGDTLLVGVTGEAGKTINWTCKLEIIKVAG